jgi:linoleoyl-CoA desaturase
MNNHAHYYAEDNTSGYVERQIETTVDYCPTSRIATLLYGGLNSHFAHHLFPNVASCHHAALYQELRSQAPEIYDRKIDLSFIQLFVEHFRFLKTMSKA